MKKILFAFLLLASGLLQQAQAQSRSVSGKVTDRATSEGLPGVTVVVKGQPTIGTSTNADGSFTLSGVPDNAQSLVMSYVGFSSQEVSIAGVNSVTVALVTDTKQLNEVVVTSLGIERNRNSLAFSATKVDGADITIARNPNFINGLSGKVAGLTIQQTNTLGGSSNVVIRGTKSITGNNQALFVVDGVPISNANTNTLDQTTGRNGYDYGNAAADINPDDIASTTILKGAAATALYGERAANGVIVITTKKGSNRKGLGVTINTGVTVGRFDKKTFITHQKEYGAGYGPNYQDPTGFFLYKDVNGDGVKDLITPLGADASLGAAFNPNLLVYQWDAFDKINANDRGNVNFGKATPWVAAGNDPTTFFEDAVGTINSFTVDGANENGYLKVGYINNYDKGILPNSKITKNTVNFAASYNVTPKLTVSGAINYSRIDGLGRYGTGYDGGNGLNLMTNFRQWWQVNVDIKAQKEAYERNNLNASWNPRSSTDPRALYWNNPYFSRNKSFESDQRNRYFGNSAVTYKFTDWFSVLGRVTADSYDEMQEERVAVGNVGTSSYTRFNRTSREYNFDLIGNFKKNLSADFNLTGLIGLNVRREAVSSIRAVTNGGLFIPEFYALSNSINAINPPVEQELRRGVDGVFASATLGFRDMVYLDLTSRRDKSTTLLNGKPYYYSSAALGFVFSEMLKDQTPWLSYGKIRANYAEVGNGAPFLSLYDTYDKPAVFPSGTSSVTLFSLPNTKNNINLQPERTKSAELGVEASFLQSRLGFDFTVYQQNTVDQIIPVNVSIATGYSFRYVNSGDVRNRGIELGVNLVPVKLQDFSWTINANWTKNQNRVMSLYEGVDNIQLASYQGGVTSNATVGQPFGSLRGANFIYRDGQRVVGADGYYLQSATANEVIGNPNPNWRSGIGNTFAYKGISLYALIDIRNGGSVFSLDRSYGLDTGMSPETAGLNDLGNPQRNTLANGGGIILPGVKEDGTPNTTRISTNGEGDGATAYGATHNPAAAFVYDASFVKLREVALTYSLPKALVSKLSLRGVDFSIIGRNLWLIHKNLPFADPEDALSSGNLGQGYSSGAYPAVRTLGANLRLSF